jgi:hypothetical protein
MLGFNNDFGKRNPKQDVSVAFQVKEYLLTVISIFMNVWHHVSL